MKGHDPIVALGREYVALARLYSGLQERFDGLNEGPLARVDKRQQAVECAIAGTPARSLEGAMYQIAISMSKVDHLDAMELDEFQISAMCGELTSILYSIFAVLERETGLTREALGLADDMSRENDPFGLTKRAAA